MERLNPLNDFLFKKLFGDEKDQELLIALLNAILEANLAELKIAKEQLNRETQEEKLGVLDIKAKTISGEKINIEVQLLDQKNMIPRTLFYWSKLFVEDFEAGSQYRQLQKTITINILDFKLEKLKKESYHTKYSLREFKTNSLLTNLMEIHFIEFPKFQEIKLNLHNPLHRWLLFLKQDVPENLLEEVTRMDAMVNKAEDKLIKLSADPETRREYELRAKALSDERSRMEDAREEGMEKGIIEVVKRLLKTGMSLQEAAKYTPYSVEELAGKLQKDR